MQWILPLLLVGALPSSSLANADQDAQVSPFAYAHVTIIDATGAPARSDMTVVISDGRISDLGRTGRIRLARDVRVEDATGKFLIPGLWDMHVHTFQKDLLPLFLANGVTGLREMFGLPVHHQLRKEIESGAVLGPRMVIGSPLLDGPNPVWPGVFTVRVTDVASAREAVARRSRRQRRMAPTS